MIHNLLSSNEIADILNNNTVITNKAKLSSQPKVDFFIELPLEIKAKLENGFGINLQQITSIPMRWIKGDTPQHIDKGTNDFNNTYLMYLTDSIGNLIIDAQSYPINAGDAYIFNEGLAHSTINTGNNERLMIGPMSELGFHVGAAYSILYFETEAHANQSAVDGPYTEEGSANIIYANTYEELYTILPVNGISSWYIATNTDGIEPSPNGPYSVGDDLVPSGIYYLYHTPTPPVPPPVTTTTTTRFSMRSLFTNNAQVYYKRGSLSTGSGGSGVTNSRIKKRRT
jgi:hypothetical protein